MKRIRRSFINRTSTRIIAGTMAASMAVTGVVAPQAHADSPFGSSTKAIVGSEQARTGTTTAQLAQANLNNWHNQGNPGSVYFDNASMGWSFNQYVRNWSVTTFESSTTYNAETNSTHLNNGFGYLDPVSGQASVSFLGGVEYQMYSFLPIKIYWGSPTVVRNANGSGSIVADVTYVDDKGNGPANGPARVTLATFANSAVVDHGNYWSIDITPDYPNTWPTDFVNFLPQDMQAWFYSTNSDRNAQKTPDPLSIGIAKTATPYTGQIKDDPASSLYNASNGWATVAQQNAPLIAGGVLGLGLIGYLIVRLLKK
ncbi:MAG: hypothetical protein Q3972_06175 [Corynebacterium sp.]|nr:hypothetical protein [Corynebacterium sp.]